MRPFRDRCRLKFQSVSFWVGISGSGGMGLDGCSGRAGCLDGQLDGWMDGMRSGVVIKALRGLSLCNAIAMKDIASHAFEARIT